MILASITAGRLSMGPEGALAPRYATFAIPAVVAVYAMLARTTLMTGSRAAGAMLAVMLVVIAVNIPASYTRGFAAGSVDQASRERAAEVLSTYESRSDMELKLSLERPPDSARRLASVLERLDYNVFAEEPSGEEPNEDALSPGGT